MSEKMVTSTVTVLLALVGVAIIAVLVSNNADTGNVLTTGGRAFSQSLGVALSPLMSSGGFTPQGTSSSTISFG